MAISTAILRLADYYRRNGFWTTIRRAGLGAKRSLFSSRSVLFYCDLGVQSAPPPDLPGSLTVERKKSSAEICPEDLQEMASILNPKLAHQKMKERFGRGASLWLIKSRDKLAGYGWTLQGGTIEAHFFPLGQDDVHLFDFHVFPNFRGQGINPLLVTHILHRLAEGNAGRAFIEAAEWNQQQLSSLKKTPVRCLGCARKSTLFGRTIVWWDKN